MSRRRGNLRALPEGPVPTQTGTIELEADPDRPGGVMVYVNGVESSYLDLDDPLYLEFEYMQQMRLALGDLAEKSSSAHVLHLGGAGCAFARALATASPASRHLVVELDGRIAELAREWFDLPRSPRLRIRVGEARETVAALRPGDWDAIVRDAFAGARVPEHLTTVEFLEQLRALLRPGGLYLGNLVDTPPLPVARREVATALQVFDHVALAVEPPILKGRRFGNLVVLAGDTPLDPALARELLGLPAPVRLVVGEELAAFVGNQRAITDAEIGAAGLEESDGDGPVRTDGAGPVEADADSADAVDPAGREVS